MMLRISGYFLLLVFGVMLHAKESGKIYQWKDQNGHWVYSDIPKKGAKEVKLHRNRLIMPATDTSILSQPTSQPVTAQYSAVIVSPEHNQTIRENTGTIYVSGVVRPSFGPNLSVQLFLNGEATGPSQKHTRFVLSNIDRGEHSLSLKVFDEKGKQVATSKAITFFLHRQSVAGKG